MLEILRSRIQRRGQNEEKILKLLFYLSAFYSPLIYTENRLRCESGKKKDVSQKLGGWVHEGWAEGNIVRHGDLGKSEEQQERVILMETG